MSYWDYHDSKMRELKLLYSKTNKQTQNRLQELFNIFEFNSDNLYDVASTQTKNKVDEYIEQWKEEAIYKGYFKVLCDNVYKKSRVKNSDILEVLIYSAYLEEQEKQKDKEQSILYDDANYYYKQGQKEVLEAQNKKKEPSALEMALFLYLMTQPNYSGFNFEQYINATIQYNVQQIYKQAVLDIQQNKPLETNSDEFQRLFNTQNNQKLCVNGDKISGAIDLHSIGLNNQAKVEGIKKNSDDNTKVRFIAVTDEHSTEMCQSMNNMEFYINKENNFDRYWGETKKDVILTRVKTNGLVLGVNLPPINHYFHYCRSTIIYLANNEEEEYNLNIPRFDKKISIVLGSTKINKKIKKLFSKYLTDENVEIDNSLDVPMRYNATKDKIVINPEHKNFENYDLSESLTHEIIHLIDVRNSISDSLNITNELRRTETNLDEDKYIELMNTEKYRDNMNLSDILSSVTNDRVHGNYSHNKKYWLEDSSRIKKELSANIMTAYLNNDTDTLYIINNITGLKDIKEKVVKRYVSYAK